VILIVIKLSAGQRQVSRTVASIMKRHMVGTLVARVTNVFHNVDFVASGPADSIDVIAQHPESRPNTLAIRHAHASFHITIGESLFIFGINTG